MKMYVWNEPYKISYGSSILYVVANSLMQAKKLAKHAIVQKYGFSDNGTLGDIKLGEPTRILDLPCAEVYHWEE